MIVDQIFAISSDWGHDDLEQLLQNLRKKIKSLQFLHVG